MDESAEEAGGSAALIFSPPWVLARAWARGRGSVNVELITQLLYALQEFRNPEPLPSSGYAHASGCSFGFSYGSRKAQDRPSASGTAALVGGPARS